jgi:DNA-directed RNA polymerase subunit RPC12/RpoP
MLPECHTHQDYADVPHTFDRVDEGPLNQRRRLASGLKFTSAAKESDMPAYVQHHEIVETPPVVCPGCIGLLPMFVRDVEPHWSMAKIDFIYECSDCGAEVRQTLTKPEQRH